jgi:hypothetical protein
MNSTFYAQGRHMKMPLNVTDIVTLVALGDPVIIVSKFVDQCMSSFNLTNYSSWYFDIEYVCL